MPSEGHLMVSTTILLTIAIIGGLMMVTIKTGHKIAPPAWLAILHGVVALTALAVFIASTKEQAAPDVPLTAIIGLIIAALGGSALFVLYFAMAGFAGFVLLFFYHLKKKELPIRLVVIHGTLAAISFIALLLIFRTWS